MDDKDLTPQQRSALRKKLQDALNALGEETEDEKRARVENEALERKRHDPRYSL